MKNWHCNTCLSARKLFVVVTIGSLSFGYIFRYSEMFAQSIKENNHWNSTSKLYNENETTYVSVCLDTFNTRRTGNMLFVLAALLYVSKFTGRNPVMPERFPYGWIDQVFSDDIPRLPNEFIYNDTNNVIIHDEEVRYLPKNNSLKNTSVILICGYFQSYRYVKEVENELRDFLKFKNSTRKLVDKFLASADTGNSTFIGIHVRRTDFTFSRSIESGLSVVDESYINEAVKYMVGLFKPSSLLVAMACSDDIEWVQRAIRGLDFATNYPNIKVVYSINHDAAFDLCLLSSCNASIISTGTFSWWSAWLANKTTIYYSLFPRPNSQFARNVNPKDYYPPSWIGISGNLKM